MKKKILAMALFAVMVLSLIPFAHALPVPGSVTKLELINQTNTSSGSGKIPGNITINNPGNNSRTLKLTANYNELTKTGQTYYETNIAKYNVFAEVYLGELASGTDVADSKLLGHARKFIDIDNIRSNGNPISPSKSVQKEDTAVKALSAKAVPNANGYSLYLDLCLGEFSTSGENRSIDYKLTWPSGSGMWNMTVTAAFENTGGSNKPVKPLYVKPAHTGDEGLYNVYVTNGVIFIDYANDIANNVEVAPAIPVKFTFFEDAGATVRIPKSGERAYVRATDTRETTSGDYASKFFFIDVSRRADVYYENYMTAANSGMRIQDTDGAQVYNNEATILGVWLPNEQRSNTNRTMRIRVEGRDYEYQTSDIKVVFRPLSRNQITTAVLVERYLKIAVGESKKLTIESASATTYNNIKLQEVNSSKSRLYIDGLTITGINVGTAQVQVTASGRVIDQITVEVVATNTQTAAPAPTSKPENQWRVLARRLNVRTGPGTNYTIAGTALMNQILTGTDQGNGWVLLSDGRFVSKNYLMPIDAYNTLGTYAVTANALNVRTGPGSSYAKAVNALPKGTVVIVKEIAYGWGNIGSGWVSMNFLK